MCGIYISLSSGRRHPPSEELKRDLSCRGPHISGRINSLTTHDAQEDIKDGAIPVKFFIFSTVLALRGTSKVAQPIRDRDSGAFLCWNGEAWKISGIPVEGNDALAVSSRLFKCTAELDTVKDDKDHTLPSDGLDPVQRAALQAYSHEISKIEGPFAFVFWSDKHKLLLFGRDCLGRRSLVCRVNLSQGFVISSICGTGQPGDWIEVATKGLYYINFKNGWPPPTQRLGNIPWTPKSKMNLSQPGALEIQSPFEDMNKAILPKPQQPMTTVNVSVAELEQKLIASLRLRVLNVPHRQRVTYLSLFPPTSHPNIAILFSGGLDCTVLARLCHDILPSEERIDLLNVAFENPRVIEASKDPANAHSQNLQIGIGRTEDGAELYDSCPDRLTAVSSYHNLVECCPLRNFRLVLIDVPYHMYEEHLPKIKELLRPHDTEMDLSIGAALYFAARGDGHLYEASPTELESTSGNRWRCPTMVMLSGLGADELFGGYSRHAMAFNRGGHAGLVGELSIDFSRLGKRNLGRDDRVLSHWGRECRYPYLDEDLIRWALGKPVWEKCGFGEEEATSDSGEGAHLEPAKKVLRLLALKLGLPIVAAEKKRAIQFGARTAKMHRGNSKGGDSIS